MSYEQVVILPSTDEVASSVGRDETKRVSADSPVSLGRGLRLGSLLRTWAEVSRINYLSASPLDIIRQNTSIRRPSIGPAKECSIQDFVPPILRIQREEDLFAEQFPVNVTPLMNEDHLWGCFYIFPELYADVYSPVVAVRDAVDVPAPPDGVLTRDIVSVHLTYLRRTPILGDYVYIKLDLNTKHLVNIEILQHFKYLVYLDLSSNYLSELSVLSYLPYLQFLSVAFNRLSTVLEYDTPQWFLTEVHYKFNSVKKIQDLNQFWSITILDLSHNNIKNISGLDSLKYLRRLDLSFNHIQRLENLNHLRLLWLDVSYNNISSYEFGAGAGLWTLLHLEYLNLNENNFTSMRMFCGCTRLRELHARNNRLSILLELAVYMRQMRRLTVLDLRANPITSTPGYQDVVLNTFPVLLSLDADELDPVKQRSSRMDMAPDMGTFASRRLLRLLYVEQLSRAKVSQHVPPADTTEVPLVILVGYEAVGKGTLARRLATECEKVVHARLHTTADHHSADQYIQVSRDKFDDMLLEGEFLSYSEADGDSYGLSREEGFIKDGKVRVACMDLASALMLKQRGRRPYLVLVTCENKQRLFKRQQERLDGRNSFAQKRMMLYEAPMEKSTLQVLLSGRIIITGILNEILLTLPDTKYRSEFLLESECSLFMDSDARAAATDYVQDVENIQSSSSMLKDRDGKIQDTSLFSLYKDSHSAGETDEYVSEAIESHHSRQESIFYKKSSEQTNSKSDPTKVENKRQAISNVTQPKSGIDFTRYAASSTWKGLSVPADSTKSSKSVTFTAPSVDMGVDADGRPCEKAAEASTTDMLIEEPIPDYTSSHAKYRTVSRISKWQHQHQRTSSMVSLDDTDLWLAFLVETGLVPASDLVTESAALGRLGTRIIDDPDSIIRQLDNYAYHKVPKQSEKARVRDDYEGIHRNYPGVFWDTVTTDDPDKAFFKLKRIIKDIVNSQKVLKPMFDINFADLDFYPTVQSRLINIRNQIAPQILFN